LYSVFEIFLSLSLSQFSLFLKFSGKKKKRRIQKKRGRAKKRPNQTLQPTGVHLPLLSLSPLYGCTSKLPTSPWSLMGRTILACSSYKNHPTC
jgi:hypothetical protein